MDRFLEMRTFVRVAEAGSLSAAGRDLDITQPAVTQQIAGLERRLGVRLLHRTTRRLTLTEAGERYLEQVRSILAAVAEAEDSLVGSAAALTGLVRIQAPTGFGQMHLTPSVLAFQARHPDLTVELLLDDRIVDVVAEGVDMAIRFGALRSPGMIARRLGSLRRFLVASPDYLAAHGAPRSPDELARHPFVRFSWTPDGEILSLIGPSGPVVVPVRSRFLANNTFALIEAMRAGVGIGGVQEPLVHHLVARGELVRVLPEHAYPPLDIHVIYPSRRFIPRKVRALVDHLADALAGIPGIA